MPFPSCLEVFYGPIKSVFRFFANYGPTEVGIYPYSVCFALIPPIYNAITEPSTSHVQIDTYGYNTQYTWRMRLLTDTYINSYADRYTSIHTTNERQHR